MQHLEKYDMHEMQDDTKKIWYERPANKIRERPNITMSQKAKARSKLSQINIIK